MSSKKAAQYRPDIDGLRAIAVVSVLAFHAFPAWAPGGFVGVDIFFVISGFLITSVILKDLRRGTFSYVEFYERRIRRIFPALALVLLVCLLIGWFLAFPDEFKALGKHVAAGAGFLSNIALWREAGYFDASAETKPLLHLWSLGIEEQYYIAWPLLVALLYRRTRRSLSIVFILALASFALNIGSIQSQPSATFYLPFTRFWELLIGSLLAYMASFHGGFWQALIARLSLPEPSAGRTRLLAGLSSWAGLLLIAAAILLTDARAAFPGWWALLPTVGTFLAIAAGPEAWLNRRVLALPSFVLIGLISYPLYLWHWPLITFAKSVTPGHLPAWSRFVLVALSIALAWLTYKFVESPLRVGHATRRTAAALASLVVAIAVCGVLIHRNQGQAARLGRSAFSKDLGQGPSVGPYLPCTNSLATFTPSDKRPLDYCVQSSSSPPVAAIFGDSHADHLFSGMAASDGKRGWLLVGQNSCPPANGVEVEGGMSPCRERVEEVTRVLTGMDSVRLVVLSFFGNYFLDDSYAADHVASRRGPSSIKVYRGENPAWSKEEAFFWGLERTIDRLEKAGKRVALVIDVPELPFFPRDRLRVAPSTGDLIASTAVTKASVLDRQRRLRVGLARLGAAHPALLAYDPLDLICDDNACRIVQDGVMFYRDSHHLSARGSVLVAGGLLRALGSW